MADFNVRADAVDVEQIMRQIRARIREKRGVDYTEEQIQELAKVKLETFLDPRGIRSDLLEQFRQMPSGVPPTYAFDDNTLFQSDKALVRFFRKLLHPFLKLLFNPNPLNQVLHQQVAINHFLIDRTGRDILFYEVVHNLVLEMTRASIDVKNMKMRVESIASRLEFNERRARALEAVVQYRPDAERERGRDHDRDRRGGESRPQNRDPQILAATNASVPEPALGPVDPITGGESLRSRRKRRRRGRRTGPGFGEGQGPGSGVHGPGFGEVQGPGSGVHGPGSGGQGPASGVRGSRSGLETEDRSDDSGPEPEAGGLEPASPEPKAESREPEAQ